MSGLDINQCESGVEGALSDSVIHSFHATHKCHNTSTVSNNWKFSCSSNVNR